MKALEVKISLIFFFFKSSPVLAYEYGFALVALPHFGLFSTSEYYVFSCSSEWQDDVWHTWDGIEQSIVGKLQW